MIDTVKEARKAYDERMEAQGWITMGARVGVQRGEVPQPVVLP